jgi:hypothetical protein
MKLYKQLKWRNGAVVLGVIALACICVSSVTAVPQMQGSVVTERLDETNTAEALYQLLQDPSKLEVFNSRENQVQIMFIIATLIEGLILSAEDTSQGFDMTELQILVDSGLEETISEEMLMEKTQGCLYRISQHLEENIKSQHFSETEKSQYRLIQQSVASVASSLDESISPHKAEIVQQILTLLLTLLLLPLLVLQGAIKATLRIIGGLLRGVLLLVRIIVLIAIGAQSVLALSALSVIFMGVMSKLALKLFTLFASPLAAIIASRITSLIGNLLGSISLALHSVVALALIFAIPLSIVVLVLVISQLVNPDGDGGTEESSLLTSFMMLTCGLLLKVKGTENLLHLLWIWIGDQVNGLPEWPY